MNENCNPSDIIAMAMQSISKIAEGASAHGRYHFALYEYEGGPIVREWDQDNVVCTEGKNLALNTYLSGSAYTVTGPYLGLISSSSYSAVSAADTMASHSGWLEAGNAHAPTYSGTRPVAAFSSASAGSISLSASLAYTFTGSGTVQGAFMTFGAGAVGTIDSTAGALYSAGAFASAQPVISGNVLSVSYTTSL